MLIGKDQKFDHPLQDRSRKKKKTQINNIINEKRHISIDAGEINKNVILINLKTHKICKFI